MPVSSLDLGIIIVYLAVMLAMGFFLGRKESVEGFFVNNRKTKLFLLIFTGLSTGIGAGTIIGSASAAYDSGISFGVSFAIASLIAWSFLAWIAPRIKEWGDKLGAFTFGDFLAARYSEGVRKVSRVVVLVAYFTIAAVQFVAFASLTEVVSGISFEVALIVAALVTITYTIFAGIKGDFYTDAVQFFVMLPVFFFLFFLGTKRIGLGELFRSVPQEFLNPTNYAGPTFFVAIIIFGFLLLFVSVEVWQRVFAAVNAKTARRAFLFSGILKVAAIASATIFGLMAFKLVGDVDKDAALFILMRELLPPGILGLGFASVLAIIMSTIDSMLMVGSATLTKDYYLLKNPDADDRKILFMGKLFVFLFGIGAFIVAFFVHDIVRLAVTAVSILATFMPALLGGLLWKRATATAAFWSILLGFITTLALLPFMPDLAALPAIILSITIFVSISFWQTRKTSSLDP